jgi:para-nitrobenzyl esterase
MCVFVYACELETLMHRTYSIVFVFVFYPGCANSDSPIAQDSDTIEEENTDYETNRDTEIDTTNQDTESADTNTESETETDCTVDAQADIETVITRYGAIQGKSLGDVTVFKGIPYAAPPVDALRFRPPLPPDCYDDVLNANDFGPVCPQLDQNTGEYLGDEDCLTLNVWTSAPLPADDVRLPVLVFIHGGGNGLGSASETTLGTAMYDGAELAAATSGVVVTVEYRLGALGWLVSPDTDEADASPGNFGILDQIAALEWVKSNIAAFGGDPSRVLIFGESAGALDVCMLLVSPFAAGLFNAALMESGGCPGYSLNQVSETSSSLIENAGCADASSPLECLRSLSAEQIVESYPPVISVSGLEKQTYYQPYVDGSVIPDDPITLLKKGDYNLVPFIIGANSDETSRSVPQTMSEAEYTAAVTATFGVLADQVLAVYPAANFDSPSVAYTQLSTDAKFVCPSRTIARAIAESKTEPVFRYFFTQNTEAALTAEFGAFHGLELLFVFGKLDIAGFTPSANQESLSLAMMTYWGNLAAMGSPNSETVASWTPYDADLDNSLVLKGGAVEMQNEIRKTECDFWNNL